MEQKLIDAIINTTNYTETENYATAYKSTLNPCLDAFGCLGAYTKAAYYSENNIILYFSKAFEADPQLSIRMLFYFRDIREGQGCRDIFRICLRWLLKNHSEYVLNNLNNIPEFGRWDDVLCLLENVEYRRPVAKFIRDALYKDYEKVCSQKGGELTLLAKWLPSEKAHKPMVKVWYNILMTEFADISGKTLIAEKVVYRKICSLLRKKLKVVERDITSKEYENIDYSKVSSNAGLKYTNAFIRNDTQRYTEFLLSGEAKANTIYPYEIVKKVIDNRYRRIDEEQKHLLEKFHNALWEGLPNYFANDEDSAICVADTSGSMYGDPLTVSISLALYCAERCKGPFNGYFITFDSKPTMQKVVGPDITTKVNNIRSINVANTDIEAVFELILNAAIKNQCKQEDLPKKIYILSDMQFDDARGHKESGTLMEDIKKRFIANGYEMPTLIYWNLRASHCGMFQETYNGENCCMVSGFSPSLFRDVMNGTIKEEVVTETGETVVRERMDPVKMMITTIYKERYNVIWDGSK